MLYFSVVSWINLWFKHWFDLLPLLLLIFLLLSNCSKVYLWRQSASRRSASVNQELQGVPSKFQLHKLVLVVHGCVVFRSDRDKLGHFSRLPSCKCDICCLEKVTFNCVETTNTKTRQEYWPLQGGKTWVKWLGGRGSFLSYLPSWVLEKDSSILTCLLISVKLLKFGVTWLLLFESLEICPGTLEAICKPDDNWGVLLSIELD